MAFIFATYYCLGVLVFITAESCCFGFRHFPIYIWYSVYCSIVGASFRPTLSTMLSPCLSNFCICGILLAVCVIGVPSFKLQQFKGVHSLTGVPFHRFSLLRPPILQNEVKFHSRDGLSPLIATKILNDYNLEVGSKPHSVYNIPNALTFIRLLSIPVFAIASYSNMVRTSF